MNIKHQFSSEALAQLPERQRFVIEAHYDRAMSFRQIGAELGLSAARAKQIHDLAIGQLKAMQRALAKGDDASKSDRMGDVV